MKVSKKLGLLIGLLVAGLFSITGFAKDKVEGAKVSKANPTTMSNTDMDNVVGAGSSGGDHGHAPSGHDSHPVRRHQ